MTIIISRLVSSERNSVACVFVNLVKYLCNDFLRTAARTDRSHLWLRVGVRRVRNAARNNLILSRCHNSSALRPFSHRFRGITAADAPRCYASKWKLAADNFHMHPRKSTELDPNRSRERAREIARGIVQYLGERLSPPIENARFGTLQKYHICAIHFGRYQPQW